MSDAGPIVILGAGAVGSYVGGMLSAAGEDVVLIDAWPGHVEAIRASGIATIIVDKNVAALSTVTDRSVIRVKGQVVFEGPSNELRNQPNLLRQHSGI